MAPATSGATTWSTRRDSGSGVRPSSPVDAHRGAHDVAGGDAPALAGELVAAARAAHALQDARAARAPAAPSRDGAAAGCAARRGSSRRPASAARGARCRRRPRWRGGCVARAACIGPSSVRRRFAQAPVEPKPPPARPVAVERPALVERDARDGAMTSCAIRMPRLTANGSRAEIDEEHLHLAAIIRVDRARRVEHRDAVPAARARSAAGPAPS